MMMNEEFEGGDQICEDIEANEGTNNDIGQPRNSRQDKSSYLENLRRYIPVNEVCEELYSLGRVACPVALTTLLIFSKNIISMLFLGHMSKSELAGGSLAIGFANVSGFSVMKGLCMGMDPICCQAYGAKKWSILVQTYIKTFILLMSSTIPISFLWLNSEQVFLKLGQDKVIAKVAQSYLVFLVPELLATAHLVPLRTFLRTQGLNSPATIVATCSTIIHLPVNYLLVTRLNLRVKGIALGSVLYTFNMNIGLIIYLLSSRVAIKPWVGLTFFSFLQGWKPLLSLALPSLLSVCLEWWWYETILFLSGLLDDPESYVAAMGILIQTTGVMYVFPFAISMSISQRVGHELGAGKPSRARLAALVGVGLGFCYGIAAFGACIGLRHLWGKLYTTDPHILSIISSTLPIMGLAEIGNSPQTAACGVLTGSARPKVGVRINVASFYLIGLPCATILAFKLKVGFHGLWWGLVAAETACIIMMVCTLLQTDWKAQAKRAEELTLLTDDGETNNIEEEPI
ncbi:hypothetical protein Leryth_022405 [Lithospermum erythrorhizon]|nr:hypothetical protein Leryth_022405 [Lithospermum erythrorhizon]